MRKIWHIAAVAVVALGVSLAVVGCSSSDSKKKGSDKMGDKMDGDKKGDKMGGNKMDGDKMDGDKKGDKMEKK